MLFSSCKFVLIGNSRKRTFPIFLHKSVHDILPTRLQERAQNLAQTKLLLHVKRFACTTVSHSWTMWSSINIRCTRLPNMVSALIIVLLRNEIKLLWRNHETQQGKNNGSKFYYRAFLSHTDSFTLSYPYLFTWNVTLYKILLWLKVRRRPNYNLSIAAHTPHTEMQCHKHLVRIGSRTPGSMSGCLNLHVPHSMEWVESVLFQIVHISTILSVKS